MDINEQVGSAIGAYIFMCDQYANAVRSFLELLERGEVDKAQIARLRHATELVMDKTPKLIAMLDAAVAQ